MIRLLCSLASALTTVLLLACAVYSPLASSQDESQPTYVTDSASLLSREQTVEIDELLSRHNQIGFAQIRLVVVPRLPPNTTIEDYASALLQENLAAPKARLDSVLFVVAIENRKLRIETSRAVSPVMSNEFCQQVIDNDVIPKFMQGEFFVGIKAGLVALVGRLTGASRVQAV